MKNQTVARRFLRWAGKALVATGFFFFSHQALNAGPVVSEVVTGNVTFNQQGKHTDITASHQSVINYTNFDIMTDESVRFIQPSSMSTVLNRVTGAANPSQILGSLSANGIVYLVNPAGVYFGKDSFIDVGQLYAAAGSLSNADFLTGINRFTDLEGDVVNYGAISGDLIALLGKHVENYGSISAPGGTVMMLAGDEVWIGEEDSHVYVSFSEGDMNPGSAAAVKNNGEVEARGGSAVFASGDMYSMAMDIGGLIEADAVAVDGGAHGDVLVSGTLDARGSDGGSIRIEGDRISVSGEAVLDASGTEGAGGNVTIGGGLQGEDPQIRNASRTMVADGARIRADGGIEGDGGEVIVWADGSTEFFGSISARGGSLVGDGGFVEVSGKEFLKFGWGVDVSAPTGEAGTLLLDPTDITIVDAPLGATVPASPVTASILNDADVAAFLQGGGDLIISTASGGVDPGDVLFDTGSDVTWTTGNNLTVIADNSITIDGVIDGFAGGGSGDLTLIAGGAITGTTGSVSAVQLSFNTTDDVTLDNPANVFATVSGSGNNVTLVNNRPGSTNLGAMIVTTNLDISTAQDIVDVGNLTVAGLASFDAGTGNITLDNNNQFAQLDVTGGAISIKETDAIDLQGFSGTSLTLSSVGLVDINATVDTSATNGAIDITASDFDIDVAASLDAGGGDVTIANTSGGIGLGDFTLDTMDISDAELDAITAENLEIISLARIRSNNVTTGADNIAGSLILIAGQDVFFSNGGNAFTPDLVILANEGIADSGTSGNLSAASFDFTADADGSGGDGLITINQNWSTSGGKILFDAEDLIIGGTLSAGSGDVFLSDTSGVGFTLGSIVAGTSGGFELSNTELNAITGNILFLSTADNVEAGGFTLADSDQMTAIHLTSGGDTVFLTSPSTFGANLTIDAVGDVTINADLVTGSGGDPKDLKIISDGSVGIAGSGTLASFGDLTLDTSSGTGDVGTDASNLSVSVTGNVIPSSGGEIGITSTGDVLFGAITGTDVIDLASSTGSVSTTTAISNASGSGDIKITAADGIDLGGDLSAAEGIALDGDSNDAVDGLDNISIPGGATLSSASGDLTLDATSGGIAAVGDLALLAGDALTVNDALTTGGDLDLVSADDDISVPDTGNIFGGVVTTQSSGDVSLGAGSDFTLGDGSFAEASSNFTINAPGFEVTVGGNIDNSGITGGDASSFVADSVVLNAPVATTTAPTGTVNTVVLNDNGVLSQGVSLAGTSTLDVSGNSNNVWNQIDLGSITGFIGDNTLDTLTLSGTGITVNLTGVNAGSSGPFGFLDVPNLISGTGDDTVNFTTNSSSIATFDAGAGSNTFDFSALSTAVALPVGNLTGTGSTNTDLIGSSNAGDSLVFNNSGVTVTMSAADAGSFTQGIAYTFTGWENLTGGTGTDTLVTSGTSNIVTVTGVGSGTTTVDLTGGFTGFENIDGGAAGDTLVGLTGDDTFVMASGVAGSVEGAGSTLQLNFDNFELLDGGAGTNTLQFPDGGNADINVIAPDAGDFNGGATSFANFGNLEGGSGDDTFTFADGQNITGTLVGGGGNDEASFAADTSGVVLNLEDFVVESIVGSSFADIFFQDVGSGFSGQLQGSGGNDTLTVTGISGNDAAVFVLDTIENNGTLTVTPDGGPTVSLNFLGIDIFDTTNNATAAITTLDLSGSDTTAVTITGNNAGNFNVGAITFSDIANLTMGAGDDTVTFDDAAALTGTIDLGAGANTLDYSAYSTGLILNLSDFTHVSTVVGSNSNDTFNQDSGATFAGTIDAGPGDDILDIQDIASLGTLTFNGGTQTSGDSILISDTAAVTTVTYAFDNNTDGNIDFDGTTIGYTGLEPITDNTSATHRIFNFSPASETISLTDTGGADGNSTIDSDVGGESVTFANPASSLTVNAGDGANIVDITGLDAAATHTVVVNGGANSDTVNLTAGIPSTIGDVTVGIGGAVENITIPDAGLTIDSNVSLVAQTDIDTATPSDTLTFDVGGLNVESANNSTDLAFVLTDVSGGSGNASIDVGANNADLQGTVGGTLDLSAGSISQSAPLTTGGVTSLNTGTGSIVLTNSANVFGDLELSAGTVQITENDAITDNSAWDTDAAALNAQANPITLDQANSISGSLGLQNTGAHDVAVTVDGSGLTLGDVDVGQNLTLTAGPGGAITGTVEVNVAGDTTFDTDSAISLSNSANTFTGTIAFNQNPASLIINDDTPVDLPSGLSTSFMSIGATEITQSGPVTATGNTTLNTGAGAINLSDAGNSFGDLVVTGGTTVIRENDAITDVAAWNTGATTLDAQGNAITLDDNGQFDSLTFDGGAVTIFESDGTQFTGTSNATSLVLQSGGDITDSLSTLTVTGNASFDSTTDADITLGDGGGDSVNFGSLTVDAGDVTITEDSAMLLAGTNIINNNLELQASGDIIDSGTLEVTNQSLFNSNGNLITLDSAGNDFGGAVLSSGMQITLVDANAIDLGITAATDTLTVTANGAITDSGDVSVTNLATFDSTNHAITLGDGTAANFGSLAFSGSNVTLTEASPTDMVASSATGNFTLNTTGAVTQTGALDIAGTSSVTATGNIILTQAGNDFTGAVSAGASNISLTDDNSIELGNVTSTGDLIVVANAGDAGGSITDSGTIDVAGASSFTTTNTGSTGDIALDTATNNFDNDANGGAVSTDGDAITLVDEDAIDLGTTVATNTLQVTTGGAITDSGTVSVTNLATFEAAAGTADITLNAADFGSVAFHANDVLVTETDAAAFGDMGTVAVPNGSSIAGNLTYDSNGVITQTGELVVAGNTLLRAGGTTFDITLTDADNDFGGNLSFLGNRVQFTDTNALAITSVSGEFPLTTDDLVLDAGGAVDFAFVTVGADLLVESGGDITDSGDLSVSGLASFSANAGSADVILGDAGDTVNFGSVAFHANHVSVVESSAATFGDVGTAAVPTGTSIGGNLDYEAAGAITQTGEILVTGTTLLDASGGGATIILTDADNDFTGDLSFDGDTVSITDANALNLATVSAVNPSAGADLTVIAGGALDFSNVTTGGDLSATSGGNITDSGDLAVTGAATFDADSGGGDVTFGDSLETVNFGSVAFHANNVTVTESSAAEFADMGTVAIPNGSFISGNLIYRATGTISQTGELVVTGTSLFDSGTDLTLTDADNDFIGIVSFDADTVQLVDSNALGLGFLFGQFPNASQDLTITTGTTLDFESVVVGNNMVATTGGDITDSGNLTVSGLATFEADGGAANVLLGDGGVDTALATVAFDANQVELTSATSIVLGDMGTVSVPNGSSIGGNLILNAATSISQTGELRVTGTSELTANSGAGDITLDDADNDFTGAVAFNGQDVTLNDTNLLSVDTVNGLSPSVGNNLIITSGAGLNIGDTSVGNDLSIDVTGAVTLADGTTADGISIELDGSADGSSNAYIGATADVSVNSGVSLESGHFTVEADNDINVAATGSITTTTSGSINLVADADSSGAGAISITDGASITTAGGTADDIRLDAADGILLSALNAGGGDVSVFTDTGDILDAGDTATDITANGVVLQAGDGIGQGAGVDAIDLEVSTVAARADAGGIVLQEATDVETNDVTVSVTDVNAALATGTTTVGPISDLITTGGGPIALGAGGAITINDGTASNVNFGVIADTTGPIRINAGDSLTINTGVTSGSGDINLVSDQTLLQAATGDVSTAGGTVRVESFSADISMTDGATTTSGGGDILYRGQTGVSLGGLDAGAGNIGVVAAAGSITDSGDTDTDVTAASAILAGRDTASGVGTGADAIDTDVSTLTGTAGSGGFFINETDAGANGLDVNTVSVSALNRNASLVASNDTETNISDITVSDGGSIVLTSANGITLNDGVDADNIAVAATGAGNVRIETSSGPLAVNSGTGSAGGSLSLISADAITQSVTGIIQTDGAGTILLTAAGSIDMADGGSTTTAGGDIVYTGTDLDITGLNAASGNVFLDSSGVITNAGDTAVDVIAGGLLLEANNPGGAAGTSVSRISTDIDRLSASVNSGGVFLSDTGADGFSTEAVNVAANNVLADGTVSGTTSGSETGLVVTNGGDLSLEAIDSIAINDGITVTGGGDTFIGAGTTLGVNAPVIGSSNMTLNAVGDITFSTTGDLSTSVGDLIFESTGGAFTMADDGGDHSFISTGGVGNVRVEADGDVTLGAIVANDALIISNNGNILDAGDVGTELTATTAILNAGAAGGGIGNNGTIDALDTNIGTLAANADTGGIFISDASATAVDEVSVDVTRVALDGTTAADASVNQSDLVTLNGGDISLSTTAGGITLNDGTTTNPGEAVNAAGSEIFISAVDVLAINSAVTSGTGNISLIGGEDVTQAAAGDISTGGTGDVVVRSSNAAVTTTDGASTTAGGDIFYEAPGNITFSGLDATGNVRVASSGGDLLDAGDTNDDIKAAEAILFAGGTDGGIGNDGTIDSIETDVTTISAFAGADGIFIDERDTTTGDGLTVGEVSVTKTELASDLSSSDTPLAQSDLVTTNAGNISLIISAGSITLNDGTSTDNGFAITADTTGNVRLDSVADINVVAGITSGTGNLTLEADGDINFTTTESALSTSGAGSILVEADSEANGAGLISMVAGSTATTGGGDILFSAGESVTLGTLDASTGNVGVVAGSSITDADADSVGDDSAGADNGFATQTGNARAENIIAGTARLEAGTGGIGVATDPLDLNATTVATSAGTDTYLYETDGLAIGSTTYSVERVDADPSGTTTVAPVATLNGGTAASGVTKVETINGSLTVDQAISAGGDILFAAGGAANSVTIDATVDSTGAGDITLLGQQDVTVNQDVETQGGTMLVRAIDGTFNQDALAFMNSNGANIRLVAGTDITLGNVNSGGFTVSIVSGGDILDAQTDTVGLDANGFATQTGTARAINVTGGDVRLEAAGSIGSAGNPLDIEVDAIAALAGTDIYLYETDALTIGSVLGTVNQVNLDSTNTPRPDIALAGLVATSGVAKVETINGSLTLSEAASAGSDILLAAGSAGSDIILDAPVTSTGAGNITLLAQNGVNQNANITSSGGTILVEARDADVAMIDGVTTTSGDADIFLNAGNDIALGGINAGTGSVAAQAGNAITDAGDTDTDVAATGLMLVAGSGVGSSAAHLETAVDTLAASADAGGIFIMESDAVAVDDVFVTIQQVGLESSNTAELNTLSDLATTNNGDISLTADGDLTLNDGTVSANTLAVNADGAGRIFLSSGANLDAASGITSGTGDITLLAVGDFAQSNTDSDISITGTGNIFNQAGGAITMVDGAVSSTVIGSIHYQAGGDITIGGLSSTAGNIAVASGGRVIDGGETDSDIAALDSAVTAISGIGAETDPIETALDTIAASTDTGGIFIAETDALAVDDVTVNTNQLAADVSASGVTVGPISDLTTSTSGNVQVTTGGTLTLNDGTATDNATAITATGTGNIYLSANGNLEAPAGANADTGDMTFLATGDINQSTAESDFITAGTGDLYAEAGGIISMADGAISSVDSGNIHYQAGGDITVGSLRSTSGIIALASGGHVIDGGETDVDISGVSAAILSADGIGSSGEILETTLGTLAATAGAGGIFITETDALTVDDVTVETNQVVPGGASTLVTVGPQSDLVSTSNGTIALSVGGTLTLNDGTATDDATAVRVDGTGDLYLSATGDLNAAAGITSGTGDITLLASGALNQSTAESDVTTSGAGGVFAQAGGALTMVDGATTSVLDGNVHYQADGDIAVGGLSSTNGAIAVASGGSVTDAGDADLDLSAPSAAGIAATGIGTGTNPLETNLDTLAASAGSGGLFFLENDTLTIDDVTLTSNQLAQDGSATPVTVGPISDLTTSNNGSISVTTTAGALTLNDGTATDNATAVSADGTGNVFLRSEAGLVDAVAGITSGSGHITIVANTNLNLSTAESDIFTTGTGSVQLQAESGALAMVDGSTVSTEAGDIRLLAQTDVTIGGLASTSGNVEVDATTGDILDGGVTDVDVAAIGGILRAADGITTVGDSLEISLTTLAAEAGATGMILVESDDVTVDDVAVDVAVVSGDATTASDARTLSDLTTSAAGPILLSAGGDLILNDGTAANVGQAVSAGTAGNIFLSSGANLDLNADMVSGSGNITLLAVNDFTQGTAAGAVDVVNISTAGGGDIVVRAAGGSIQAAQSAATSTATGTGSIFYQAGGDAQFGQLNAGANNIRVDAGNNIEGVGTAGNVIATDAILAAGGGISLLASGQSSTQLDRLAAVAGAGGMAIFEIDGLTVADDISVGVTQIGADNQPSEVSATLSDLVATGGSISLTLPIDPASGAVLLLNDTDTLSGSGAVRTTGGGDIVLTAGRIEVNSELNAAGSIILEFDSPERSRNQDNNFGRLVLQAPLSAGDSISLNVDNGLAIGESALSGQLASIINPDGYLPGIVLNAGSNIAVGQNEMMSADSGPINLSAGGDISVSDLSSRGTLILDAGGQLIVLGRGPRTSDAGLDAGVDFVSGGEDEPELRAGGGFAFAPDSGQTAVFIGSSTSTVDATGVAGGGPFTVTQQPDNAFNFGQFINILDLIAEGATQENLAEEIAGAAIELQDFDFEAETIDEDLLAALVQIGVFARRNTPEETIEGLQGYAVYVQDIDRFPPRPSDYYVHESRISERLVREILDAYVRLTRGEGEESRLESITEILSAAWERYQTTTTDPDSVEFGRYARTQIEPARVILDEYAYIFELLENIGLSSKELEIAKLTILRQVQVPGLVPPLLLRAIEQGKPANYESIASVYREADSVEL